MLTGSFFHMLFRMSISGTLLLFLFLLIRKLLSLYPRKYCSILWGMLALRLLVPVFLPLPDSLWKIVPNKATADIEILASNHSALRIFLAESPQNSPKIILWVWLAGFLLLATFYLVTFFRVTFRTKAALHIQDNVYITDYTRTAFVLGVVKPKIMIPSSAEETDREYMILHEKCHIQNKDSLFKLVAWLVIMIHWFNPFVWFAAFLFTSDLEMSCDEKVLQTIGMDKAGEYAETLLKWTVGKQHFSYLHTGIGGGSVKKRIRHIARCKRPKKSIFVLTGIIAVLVTSLLVIHPAAQSVSTVIERYYSRAYDSWWNLKMNKFDDVLDLDSIQSQNFLTAMEENIYRWKYIIDNGHYEGERERFDLCYSYQTIEYSDDGNHATVVVKLSGEEAGMSAYPAFIALGQNKFELVREKGNWKISGHKYEDFMLFEQSLDELIEFDKTALTEQLDREFTPE